MRNGLGRAAALPLVWAFVWAIPGFGIEALSNLGVAIGGGVDMWPQTLAIPGFLAGLLFTALVAASGRWRTFEASSTRLLLGLGLVVGLAMDGIIATGAVGGEESAWTYVFALVMSLLSAVASALLFRFLARRGTPAQAQA